MAKNENSEINEEPSFSQTNDKLHNQIWQGHFYKVNVCGAHKVPIKSISNLPCDGKFNKCVSFDKGTCIEIIQKYKTRYTILRDKK